MFLNTADGAAGLLKMPNALAMGVASSVGSAWPLFAPLIGGFGAFVAGSNTVSNMTFSLFQFGVGEQIGLDHMGGGFAGSGGGGRERLLRAQCCGCFSRGGVFGQGGADHSLHRRNIPLLRLLCRGLGVCLALVASAWSAESGSLDRAWDGHRYRAMGVASSGASLKLSWVHGATRWRGLLRPDATSA